MYIIPPYCKNTPKSLNSHPIGGKRLKIQYNDPFGVDRFVEVHKYGWVKALPTEEAINWASSLKEVIFLIFILNLIVFIHIPIF